VAFARDTESEAAASSSQAARGPRGRLDLLELQRTAGNRATRALLQRFWVKTGGTYRWETDESAVTGYAQTGETYWSYWRPRSRPVYVPLSEAVAISTETLLGVTDAVKQPLLTRLDADLKLVNRSRLGTRLLGTLATARHRTKLEPTEHQPSSGPITGMTMTKNKLQHDPFDPTKGAPATINLKPEDVDVSTLPLELIGVGHVPPPMPWNPTPGHVALFHELVHAYHFVNGTRVRGQLTAAQATHPGDVGVSLSEYQVTGIDTRDGAAATAFSGGQFTENAYRAEVGLPARGSYIPLGYRAPQAQAALLGMG
jgi:hypothetical protein